MSFLAKLIFQDDAGESEENFHTILECSFDFNVGTDRRGKRTEKVRGGQISLVLESSRKDDFLQWIKDPEENRDGRIIFYEEDGMKSGMTVNFSEADCIQYSEDFKADGTAPMLTRIVIAPFQIAIGETEVFLWEDQEKQKKHKKHKKRKRQPSEKPKATEELKEDEVHEDSSSLKDIRDYIWGEDEEDPKSDKKSLTGGGTLGKGGGGLGKNVGKGTGSSGMSGISDGSSNT